MAFLLKGVEAEVPCEICTEICSSLHRSIVLICMLKWLYLLLKRIYTMCCKIGFENPWCFTEGPQVVGPCRAASPVWWDGRPRWEWHPSGGDNYGLHFVPSFITGWWFGTFFIFPYIGNAIIPTDFHNFQRGWNHQPDTFCFSQTLDT